MESSQNNTKTEYTPNEYVSYGTSGVCQIVSVEQRSFDGEHEESYYKPVSYTHLRAHET